MGEAEGYAASLRQMADANFVDFDELRAAADLIERQAKALSSAITQARIWKDILEAAA